MRPQVSRTRRWAPTSAFPRSAAPTSRRAGCRCRPWPRPATPRPTRCCTGAISSRGTWSSSASCRQISSGRLDTSGRRPTMGSRSSISTHRRSPARATKGDRSLPQFGRTTATREWDGRTHSIYHALQATINRRFSGGFLMKGAYTWSKAIDEAPIPTGRSSAGTRRACSTATARSRTTISPTTSSLGLCTSSRSATGRSGRRVVSAAQSWEAGR